MSDDQLPIQNGGITDVLGIGKAWQCLIGPIMNGVGNLIGPHFRSWENRKQISRFDAWDEAFKARGYAGRSVELSLANRAEIKMLADKVIEQKNIELVAAAAIDYARHNAPIPNSEVNPPTDEWIDTFWRVAQTVSGEEAQRFFGIILARRAACETAVTPRALNFLSLLSGEEAKEVERLASLRIRAGGRWGNDSGVFGDIHLADRPDSHAIRLDMSKLVQSLPIQNFGSLGLLYEGGMSFALKYRDLDSEALPLAIGASKFLVRPNPEQRGNNEYSVGSGWTFTPLGVEIADILSPPADAQFVGILKAAATLLGVEVKEQ